MLDNLEELLTYENVFFLLLLVFLVTVFMYLVVSGLFSPITVKTTDTKYGPMVIAYKTRTGPYKLAGDLFTDSYCLLPNREQVGIYYDDPETVPENELRFAVGPILSNGAETPSKEEMETMTSHGFKIFHLPKANYVVTATFPFRTTLSVFIAIFRVYPKLRSYIAEKNLCAYPAIEIYTDREIVFIMPLSRQEEFYVSEFVEEDVSVATTDMGSVAGDARDAEDVFLKPRTPVRMNRIRESADDSVDESSEDGGAERSEPEEGSADTASSFDDLAAELEEKRRNI